MAMILIVAVVINLNDLSRSRFDASLGTGFCTFIIITGIQFGSADSKLCSPRTSELLAHTI